MCSARVRIQKAKSVPQDKVEKSEYTLRMWQLYSRLDVDTHVKWILAHMPVQLQAIYGRKIETGKEFLDIPKTWKTMSDLEEYLCYHITGIDKAGNLVVHYSGSAAARKGSGGKGRSSVSFFFPWLRGCLIIKLSFSIHIFKEGVYNESHVCTMLKHQEHASVELFAPRLPFRKRLRWKRNKNQSPIHTTSHSL